MNLAAGFGSAALTCCRKFGLRRCCPPGPRDTQGTLIERGTLPVAVCCVVLCCVHGSGVCGEECFSGGSEGVASTGGTGHAHTRACEAATP